MRTTITVAKQRKDGQWKLISGPDVSLREQWREFRGKRGTASDEFSEIRIQDSDGDQSVLFLPTAADLKKSDARRAAEAETARKASEAEAKTAKELAKQIADEVASERAEETARLSGETQPAKTANVAAPEPIAPAVDNKTGLRTDGPTPKEWVAQGFNISKYPPKGYAAKTDDGKIKS